MPKRLTKEEFVSRSRVVHGDKYNYSKVVYVNSKTKVCIICPKHGEFWQTPSDHMNGCGCTKCSKNVPTTKEFISKAIKIHGDKYDYSKVVYVNDNTNVVIVCKKCGIAFPQRPRHHLEGSGCPQCARERQINKGNKKTRTIKNDIGVVDFPENVAHLRSYHVWREIIRRCYDEKYRKRYPTYKGVTISKEWMSFSLFKKWFDENYVNGYVLDKDLLSGKENKVYSPETCCFVPPSLNSLLTRRNKLRGAYPIGVYRQKNGTFSASIRKYGKSIHLGIYKTIEEAFKAYKRAKETYIKEVAQSYFDKGEIAEKVYNALMNYKVEITD